MPDLFCRDCGEARIGSFRFCRMCGLDFDSGRPGDGRLTSEATRRMMSSALGRQRVLAPRVAVGRQSGLGRTLRTALLISGASLLVAWFFFLRPMALGGPASYLVVSGVSMEPNLHTGDLVVVRQLDSYQVGDVVAYRVPEGQPSAGAVVIHRIVGGDAQNGFIMQGDNNSGPDPWRPGQAGILGRSWVELPGSGRLLLILRQPMALALLLGGIAGIWVLGGGPPKAGRSRAGRKPNGIAARHASTGQRGEVAKQ